MVHCGFYNLINRRIEIEGWKYQLFAFLIFIIMGIGLCGAYGPKVIDDKNPTHGEKIGFGFGITFLIIFVPVVFWQLSRICIF